jgi:hypothetical protein
MSFDWDKNFNEALGNEPSDGLVGKRNEPEQVEIPPTGYGGYSDEELVKYGIVDEMPRSMIVGIGTGIYIGPPHSGVNVIVPSGLGLDVSPYWWGRGLGKTGV